MQENWDRISHQLSNQYKGHGYKHSLFKNIAFLRTEITERSETRIVLGVPSDLERQLIHKTLICDIKNEIQKFMLSEFSIEFDITGPQTAFPIQLTEQAPAVPEAIVKLPERLDTPTTPVQPSDYSLSSVVVGAENGLLVKAIERTISAPVELSFPLLITGASGVGKSHHAKAMWWELRQQYQGERVKLITGERFLTDFLEHIRSKQTWKFQKKYRNETDALIIDDISCLRSAKKTQEEFLAVLDYFCSQKKIIVVTSPCMPSDLPGLDPALTSRMTSGLHIALESPGVEFKIGLVEALIQKFSFCLEPECIALIAANSKCFRAVKGYVNKINFLFANRSDTITLTELSKYLKFENSSFSFSTPEQILRHTSEKFKIETKVIVSKARSAPIVVARNYAICLMRERLGLSLQEIGRHVGYRDHSTIRHALANV